MAILMVLFVVSDWNAVLERHFVGAFCDSGPGAKVSSYWALSHGHTIRLLPVSRMAHIESFVGGEARRKIEPLHHRSALRNFLNDVRVAFCSEEVALLDR